MMMRHALQSKKGQLYREYQSFAHGLSGHELIVLQHIVDDVFAVGAAARVVVQTNEPAIIINN
jgi:hypothetical protein